MKSLFGLYIHLFNRRAIISSYISIMYAIIWIKHTFNHKKIWNVVLRFIDHAQNKKIKPWNLTFYCIEGNLYINNVYLYVTAKLDLCAISILRFPAALLASGHKTVFFVLSMAFHECLNCSQNFRRRGGWTQSMVLKRNHAFLIFY